jgi:hypothetical protein
MTLLDCVIGYVVGTFIVDLGGGLWLTVTNIFECGTETTSIFRNWKRTASSDLSARQHDMLQNEACDVDGAIAWRQIGVIVPA